MNGTRQPLESGGPGRFMVSSTDQPDFRYSDVSLMWWVSMPTRLQHVPVGLVCGGLIIANADCAYDPHLLYRLFRASIVADDYDRS